MSFAVIQTGGKQYKVSQGAKIEVEKLDAEVGLPIEFHDVLMVASSNGLLVGTPYVQGAKVTAEVLEQAKAPKVIAFKYKRRKGYHRTVGHRRRITKLRITEISY